MHISFIIFNIFVLIVIVVAAYALGRRISKESKQNAPEALNNTPYDDCIKENEAKFKYGTFTDARDGETYRTIQIGNQVWMAENLRFKTDGSYAPNNDESNVAKFGRLYTWTKALDIPDETIESRTRTTRALPQKVGIFRATRNGNSSSAILTQSPMVVSCAANSCGRTRARIRSDSLRSRRVTALTTATSAISADAPVSGARMNTARLMHSA